MAGQSEQFSSNVSPLDAVSKVELSISCTNLKDMDVFSKSDPVVFLYEKRGKEWQKIGRTEVIDNNLNPKVFCGAEYIIMMSVACYDLNLIVSQATPFSVRLAIISVMLLQAAILPCPPPPLHR